APCLGLAQHFVSYPIALCANLGSAKSYHPTCEQSRIRLLPPDSASSPSVEETEPVRLTRDAREIAHPARKKPLALRGADSMAETQSAKRSTTGVGFG